MGPKRGQVQLQVEIENEEQLEEFINKPGLGIIDVYSEWAGPCAPMVPFLKRIKVDLGDNGDMLNFAIAKNDTITSLERFRGKSEPHWLFVSRGKVVRLFVGSNYPRLEDAIKEEIKKQIGADQGNDTRVYITVATLTPSERAIADKKETTRKREQEIELQNYLQKLEDRRIEIATSIADMNELITCIVIYPQYAKKEKRLKMLRQQLESSKPAFMLQEKVQKQITDEQIEKLKKFAGLNLSKRSIEMLQDGRAYIWLIKCDEEFLLSPVEYVFARVLYGERGEPPGEMESPITKFLKVLPWLPEEEEMEAEEEEEEEAEEIDVETKREQEVLEEGEVDEVEEEQEQEQEQELEQNQKIKDEALPPSLEKKKRKKKEPEPKKESDSDEDILLEEDGEVICCIWTPLEPYKFARATALYEFFYDTMLPYIPSEPLPIPPHLACIYPAEEIDKVMEVIHEGNFRNEILNYGFFDTNDPVIHQVVANSFLEYKAQSVHSPEEVLVLSVAQKRSYPIITLAELKPIYVSDNTDIGQEDCLQWFPNDWVQGTEFIEEEEEEEESSVDMSTLSTTLAEGEYEDEEDYDEND